jgi:hypothetical protein
MAIQLPSGTDHRRMLRVCVVAIAYRVVGLCVSDCLDSVPHWRALTVLAFFAYLVKGLESYA